MSTSSPSNPQTERQQAHRMNFGLVARLSSDLKALHTIGLHHATLRRKQVKKRPTTFDIFRRLNRHCATSTGVDYSAVLVSKGSLTPPEFNSVQLTPGGRLSVHFSTVYYDGDPADELLLAVYCPELRSCFCADAVSRSAGHLAAQLPRGWLACSLHIYAFFCGKKMATSRSTYHPLCVNSADPINPSADPINRSADPINCPADPIKSVSDPINPNSDPINRPADPINSSADPITDRLYAALRADATLSYAAYAESLGVSQATVKRRLADLKAQGLIRRCGSNKAGYWEVIA